MNNKNIFFLINELVIVLFNHLLKLQKIFSHVAKDEPILSYCAANNNDQLSQKLLH